MSSRAEGEGTGQIFRYDTAGTWYKGNIHIHSTVSDGGMSFAEIARIYSDAGYSFLFRTDHGKASDVARDDGDYPLLWMDGVEIDGQDPAGSMFHVVCLGTFTGLDGEAGFVERLESARAQGGVLVLAHPFWSGNTFEDAVRWRFDGVEVYNHVCRWLNGKGRGLVHWNAMLLDSPGCLAFAADDAHLRPEHPTWNGGWIVVNAAACNREAIMSAIRAGNYYSSCGPEFRSIALAGDAVTLSTSPVRFARLVGPGPSGARLGSPEGELLTETSFRIPEGWPYCYVEIEDEGGRRAWTNTLFVA